jgi:hypothetical protein
MKNKNIISVDTLDDTQDDILKNPNFRLFLGDMIPHPHDTIR